MAPKYRRREDNFEKCLALHIISKAFPSHLERFHQFLVAAGALDPPATD